MIAGGLGNIRGANVDKHEVNDGMCVVVLGGPAMLIGLGGGAASSASSGTGDETLDFASVQRGNAEMQRRAQQVIDACWAMDENNPIVSIHDVGAGVFPTLYRRSSMPTAKAQNCKSVRFRAPTAVLARWSYGATNLRKDTC